MSQMEYSSQFFEDPPKVLDLAELPRLANGVKFTIDPDTRGCDVLATLKYLYLDPEEYARRVDLLLRMDSVSDYMSNALLPVPDPVGRITNNAYLERTIRFGEKPSFDDIDAAVKLSFSEEEVVACKEIIVSGLIDSGHLAHTEIWGIRQRQEVVFDPNIILNELDKGVEPEIIRVYELDASNMFADERPGPFQTDGQLKPKYREKPNTNILIIETQRADGVVFSMLEMPSQGIQVDIEGIRLVYTLDEVMKFGEGDIIKGAGRIHDMVHALDLNTLWAGSLKPTPSDSDRTSSL